MSMTAHGTFGFAACTRTRAIVLIELITLRALAATTTRCMMSVSAMTTRSGTMFMIMAIAASAMTMSSTTTHFNYQKNFFWKNFKEIKFGVFISPEIFSKFGPGAKKFNISSRILEYMYIYIHIYRFFLFFMFIRFLSFFRSYGFVRFLRLRGRYGYDTFDSR